ncbi:MAG: hypothetical protein JKY70_15055 [Mucilaginibacter sp.]|nr:hypothetical protein [Mucilaginibacter sp.]
MYKPSFIHTATFLAMLGFFSIACESNTKKTAKIADSGFTAPTLIANVKHDSAKSEKSKIDSDKPEASAEPVKRTAEKSKMINASKKNQQTVFGYDVVSALPPNHVTDGSVDYTSYLQDAIDKHDQLTFPAFPVLVNDKGLNIGSNKTIKFPKGSVINLAKSAQGGYSIVRLFNVQNVVLDGLVIKGDRNNHIGTSLVCDPFMDVWDAT